MPKYLKFIISVVGCEAVGLISGVFTIASIPTWYVYLQKPPFSPPNRVFGPVWTFLYLLMGISLYLVWKRKRTQKTIIAINIFCIQLSLNFLWSFLFFGLHSPLLGLLDILFMLILIMLTIRRFYSLSKNAAYLLIPYLLWVSFATILNLSIVYLN